MTLTFDLYLTLTLSLTLMIWRNTFISFFFHFLWSHVTQKGDVVRDNGRSHAEAPFYKEHFAANQKSLPLPVKKLWPIIWFSLNLLKSRDVKTWRRTSNGASLTEAEFNKEGSETNQKSLPLPVQKLWPIIWFSQKWWPWPCALSDFQKKNAARSQDRDTSTVTKSWPAVWSVHRERTDKHANKQMKGHSESAYFAKLDLQVEWFTLLWQRWRTQSIGPNDSNERWQWIEYYLASILLQ